MEPEEINRWIAENVIQAEWFGDYEGTLVINIDGRPMVFDPYNNIAQAMEAADKYYNMHGMMLTLSRFDEGWEANFFNQYDKVKTKIHDMHTDTPSAAICRALVAAGGEG